MLLKCFIVFTVFPSLILASVCIKNVPIKGKTRAIKVCCNGYKREKSNINLECTPICNPNCGNGTCVSPNTCECFDGYDNDQHITSNICVPVCKIGCQNGECIAPDMCKCNAGYVWDASTGQCAPFCSRGCANGQCTAPETCTCSEGYTNEAQEINAACQPICDFKCGSNRTCTAPNTCVCLEGFIEIANNCLYTSVYIYKIFNFAKKWTTGILACLFVVVSILALCCSSCSTSKRVISNVAQKGVKHHISDCEAIPLHSI